MYSSTKNADASPKPKSQEHVSTKSTPVSFQTTNLKMSCLAHSKKATAYCSHPECEDRVLCSLDLKTHPHSRSVYSIGQVSDPEFLEEIFSLGNVSNCTYNSQVQAHFTQFAKKLEQLSVQLKDRLFQKVESQLDSLSLIHKKKHLQNLQRIYKEEQTEDSLGHLVREVDETLTNDLNSEGVQKLKKISDIYERAKRRIQEISEKVCSYCHLVFDEVFNPKNEAILKTKQDKLSIINTFNYFIKKQSIVTKPNMPLDFLALHKIPKEQASKRNASLETPLSLNSSKGVPSIEKDNHWNLGLESMHTLGALLNIPEAISTKDTEKVVLECHDQNKGIITDSEHSEKTLPDNNNNHNHPSSKKSTRRSSRNTSSQIGRIPSDLVNEVIQNFDLEPGYFKQNRFSGDSPGRDHTPEEYTNTQSQDKINKYLKQNQGIETPKAVREKKIKMISEFDHNLLPRLEVNQVFEVETDSLVFGNQQRPCKNEIIISQNSQNQDQKNKNIESFYPSVVQLTSPNQTNSRYHQEARILTDSALLRDQPEQTNENSESHTKEKLTEVYSLEPDESVMDIVLQNFEGTRNSASPQNRDTHDSKQTSSIQNESKTQHHSGINE